MLKNFKKLALAAAAGLALGAPATQAADLKVGFVYVGPISDHGWSYRHNVGRLAIEKVLGGKVKTTFVESVPEGPDAERVIRQMASSGHDLIFTTSFGYMNPTLKVAKRFPKVSFEHATGYKRGNNVSTYSGRFYEGRHIAGLVAGHMTKTAVIGYVASFPIPEVIRGINAVALAARSVNPNVQVKVIWVNSWYDPGKEGDAAKVLIDQGADIIMQHTDSPAPLQVAEKRGVWAVGQASDNSQFAPKAQLTAIIDDWDGYYVARAKAVLDGSWKSMDSWGGIKSGMVQMAPYNKAIPANVIAIAKAAEEGLRNGTIHAFAGPVKNQAGKEMVPAGKNIDDGTLLGMDWYVEGVQGKLPK